MPLRSLWTSQPVRWLAIGGVVVILVILAGVAGLLWNLRNDQILKSQKELESLTLALSEQIDRSFQSVELIQNEFIERAQAQGVQSAAEFSRAFSDEETHYWLRERVLILPYVDAVVLIDHNGRNVNFSRGWPVPPVTAGAKITAKFKDDPTLASFIEGPVRSPAHGEWVLRMAHKVTGRDGELLGAVVGIIKLEYLENYFKRLASSESNSISLHNDDSMLVVRYPRDESLMGRSLANRAIFQRLSMSGFATVRQNAITDRGDLLVPRRSFGL